ncbi:MAG: orotidine-5'-phosphate decarboxylase [Jatrophihabitans sp.]
MVAATAARGSLCVGVDPHASLLTSWGLSDDATGLAAFTEICTEAFGPTAAVIKPQSAFFERFGSAGIAVLEQLTVNCRAQGALVLLDVKRGDIGSTMDAYAEAYLDPASPLAADAITVSPYLGVGALEPALDLATKHGNGVFVLALTSNKAGSTVQHAVGASGRLVAQEIVDDLGARNAGADPLGSFGVVVGATVGEIAADLSGLNGPVLVPGVGAQGGTAADVRRLFGSGRGILPSASRAILGRGPSVPALQAAVAEYVEQLAFLSCPGR